MATILKSGAILDSNQIEEMKAKDGVLVEPVKAHIGSGEARGVLVGPGPAGRYHVSPQRALELVKSGLVTVVDEPASEAAPAAESKPKGESEVEPEVAKPAAAKATKKGSSRR